MTDHIHTWIVLTSPDMNKLECVFSDCHTVITIQDLIANERQEAATEAKVKLLTDQLFKGDLKRQAHDEAYAYVTANGKGELDRQGSLL